MTLEYISQHKQYDFKKSLNLSHRQQFDKTVGIILVDKKYENVLDSLVVDNWIT
jgi:hypothetical protein